MSSIKIQKSYDKCLKPVLYEIKNLNIQGATNVALEGVKAFSLYAEEVHSSFNNESDYLNHLNERSHEVKSVRITEPALANGLNFVLTQISLHGYTRSIEAGTKYQEILHTAKKQTAEVGSELILDGSTVMTHCHSSFVDEIMTRTKSKKVSFHGGEKYQDHPFL